SGSECAWRSWPAFRRSRGGGSSCGWPRVSSSISPTAFVTAGWLGRPDMLVVMRQDATPQQIQGVVAAVEARGFRAHPIPGGQRTAIGVTGNKGTSEAPVFESLPGVLEVIPVTHAYKLVSREVKVEDTVVEVGTVRVGGPELVVVAGPCAV